MINAEDIKTAQNLLVEWEKALNSSSLDQAGGSIVRIQMEKVLNGGKETLGKLKQAQELRQQIDSLPDGVVKQHMGAALEQLEVELGIALPKAVAAAASQSWELKISVEKDASAPQQVILNDCNGQTRVGSLKAMIEEKTGIPRASQEVRLLPSKQILGGDNCNLATLSVCNRDNLLVTVKSTDKASDEIEAVTANRVEGAGVKVKGGKDALALAIHVMLGLEGFTCYQEAEEESRIPGFAPSVRPVPPSQLVPTRWNADPSHVSFSYRHNQLPGKDVKMKVMWLDERVVVEARDASSSNQSGQGPLALLNLTASDFVDVAGASSSSDSGGPATLSPMPLLRNLPELRLQLLRGFLPALGVTPSSTSSTAVPSMPPEPTSPFPPIQPLQPPPPFAIPVPYPLGPMPPAPFPSRGIYMPDFGGDLEPGTGGSNLMGPNHPIFTGEGRPFPPYPGGLGMPTPRFDPYGPVIPPTRGGPPARGPIDPNDPRGRGQAFREPDPDHLPPPGPGNMYF